MAAEDIRMQRRLPVVSSYHEPIAPEADRSRGSGRDTFIMALLRRRWLSLLAVGIVSGAVAFAVAKQFSGITTQTEAVLEYVGLPLAPGPNLPPPLTPDTCAEIITSPMLLKDLCEKQNLDATPSDLAQQIKTKSARNSQLLTVTLTWSCQSAETEGCEVLNGLTKVFIDRIAADRQAAADVHLREAERALLMDANVELEKAREDVKKSKGVLQNKLDPDGSGGEQQRIVMNAIADLEARVDEKNTEIGAINEQLERLTPATSGTPAPAVDTTRAVRIALLREVNLTIELGRAPCAEDSPAYQQWTDLAARVRAYGEKKDAPADVDQWFVGLLKVLQEDKGAISGPIITRVSESFAKYQPPSVVEAGKAGLDPQRQTLELNLISAKRQKTMLERRWNEMKTKLVKDKPGVIEAEQSVYQAEQKMKDAEAKVLALRIRKNALEELKNCKAKEWAELTPASRDTTEVRSSGKKLFVLVFGLCGLLLAGPIAGLEWLRQRTGQVEFVRSLELPILADRVLENFLPQRRQAAPARLSQEDQESLRMLALRIQQSVHRSGAIVLFTSLDAETSAAPLMAAVAECLAAREERVLILDAVSPEKAALRLVDIAAGAATKALPAAEGAAAGNSARTAVEPAAPSPGLAEYFCDESQRDVHSLIRPTGCPGVDFIGSGQVAFPREAMASSYLTQLLDACRKDYTMILVNGPATRYAADVEMLAARADGLVVAANDKVKYDDRSATVLKDLVDLGAPIIGVVV